MKLTKVTIHDFQCVRNSNPINISQITCLVGKNESGKTALLQAIYRLNPLIAAHDKFDVTDDYPRADVEDYNKAVEAGEIQPTIVTEAHLALSSEEISAIETEFGRGVLTHPEMVLKKGYGNQLIHEIKVREQPAVRAFLAAAQLPAELEKELSAYSDISSLAAACETNKDSSAAEHIARLKSILTRVTNAGGLEEAIYETHLAPRIPKFLYFDEYFLMTGAENIEALVNRVKSKTLRRSDYPLLGLIALARIELDELLNPQRTQWLVNKLEGASNHLSKKVLKYWS